MLKNIAADYQYTNDGLHHVNFKYDAHMEDPNELLQDLYIMIARLNEVCDKIVKRMAPSKRSNGGKWDDM